MNFLKIAVLNNSGNVGKSTICSIFLQRRIANAELICVETINTGSNSDHQVSSKDMIGVFQHIDASDVAIIDVGSSNIEGFIQGMRENTGAHEDIDLYLVPVTPENKQQKDTCNTIDELLDLGVPDDRIILLLNRVDHSFSLEHQFKTLVSADIMTSLTCSNLDECITIPDSDIFSLIERLGTTYHDTLTDRTDYRQAIRDADSKQARSVLSLKKSCQRLVKSFDEKLNIEYLKLQQQLERLNHG
ncbi:StbB family protein [Vibrio aerogenes]|uniref:StbB family protein n=1 Tax=Vibrio aerogenes TaxID=92172 RepID=UPI0021C2777D|nr:StbB family protein [Vibrio aerogenes]